jgi:hypothetical protein
VRGSSEGGVTGSRVPDAVQRETLRRRAGTQHLPVWTPDQQRTTPRVRRAALHPGNTRTYSFVTRSRSALPTTLTDDSAIAAAAMIGDSKSPNAG